MGLYFFFYYQRICSFISRYLTLLLPHFLWKNPIHVCKPGPDKLLPLYIGRPLTWEEIISLLFWLFSIHCRERKGISDFLNNELKHQKINGSFHEMSRFFLFNSSEQNFICEGSMFKWLRIANLEGYRPVITFLKRSSIYWLSGAEHFFFQR